MEQDNSKRTYGTGSVTHIEGDRWLLKVSAGKKLGGKRDRPQKTVIAKNRRDAERQLKAFEASIRERTSKERLTLNGLIDLYVENHLPTLAPRTQKWYINTLRRVRGALGHMLLTDIKPLHIKKFYSALADPDAKAFWQEKIKHKNGSEITREMPNGLNGEYILHHHRALSGVLRWGYENEYTDHNVMDRIKPPESDTQVKRALTPEEIRKFLDELDRRKLKWRTFFTLALVTGMRREEMCGLEWEHIDFAKNTISIKQAAFFIKKKNEIGPPKNKASIRVIDAPAQIFALLKSWKAQQNAERLAWPEPWDDTHKFVFTEPHGGSTMIDNCTNMARAIFDKLDMSDITLHNLRHTSVTRQLAAGIPAPNVAAYHGHASTKMTLDRYGKPAAEYRDKCAEVGASIFAIRTPEAQTKKTKKRPI